jgi:hypothetical protein
MVNPLSLKAQLERDGIGAEIPVLQNLCNFGCQLRRYILVCIYPQDPVMLNFQGVKHAFSLGAVAWPIGVYNLNAGFSGESHGGVGRPGVDHQTLVCPSAGG